MATEPAAGDPTSERAEPAAALVDWQIKQAVDDSELIIEGYHPEAAKYATYEARASNYVQRLAYNGDRTMHVTDRAVDGSIWIASGETVKLYTIEVFNLPDDMYAVVTGLGQLYACGLSIGSTYVDPGSRGAIYLAVTNVSPVAVCLPVGIPIARFQFWRLGETPTRKHLGHQARRRIELTTRAGGSRRGRPADDLSQLQRKVSRLGATVVIQMFALVGLIWYANPTALDSLLRFAAGDDLPAFAHFLVPAVAGPVLFLLARWAWSALRPLLLGRGDGPADPD